MIKKWMRVVCRVCLIRQQTVDSQLNSFHQDKIVGAGKLVIRTCLFLKLLDLVLENRKD